MPSSIDIDPRSGFCGGVIRAIDRAEEFLSKNDHLYSLGSMVHNEEELRRLSLKGLRTLSGVDSFSKLPKGETVLIRAHGEPPSTYKSAENEGVTLIDCTCPVVLQLQKRIGQARERLEVKGGRVIIFGKVGHAEVLGLLGRAGSDAIVVETMEDLPLLLEELDASTPLEVFSQTTRDPSDYGQVCDWIRSRFSDVQIHDTICRQVSDRYSSLRNFASSHDIVIFVAGGASSNGKVLFELCRSVNPRTYLIASPSDLKDEWFRDDDRVGICGATSTPKWLLEQTSSAIAPSCDSVLPSDRLG